MKLFLDTNIFLDLILKREYFEEAVIIFNAIEKNIFEAVILDITLLNIDHVAKKQIKDIREFLTIVNSIFKVIGASNNMIADALTMENNDLEDNLQYISAKSFNCDLIITNDKNFYSEDIITLNSVEFVNKYIT